MKTLFRILTATILLLMLTNCKKDNTPPTTGKLEVTYNYVDKVTRVDIFSEAGNNIYTLDGSVGNFSLDLNPGNYNISSWNGPSGGIKFYYQIRAGFTTRVIYDEHLAAHVVYE